jgi:hypothetical protein
MAKEEKVQELGGGFKPVNCEPEVKEEPKADKPEVKEQA